MAPNEITRAVIVAEIEGLEQPGRPGAAEYFRKCAATFLNWLVERGAIAASPMASYRRPKETRAHRLAQRRWVMTAPDELRRFWEASSFSTLRPDEEWSAVRLIRLYYRRGRPLAPNPGLSDDAGTVVGCRPNA